MTITVNGKVRAEAPATLLDLLEEQGYGPGSRGVAVALNGEVVPKGAWEATDLKPGDSVEIVKVLQGG